MRSAAWSMPHATKTVVLKQTCMRAQTERAGRQAHTSSEGIRRRSGVPTSACFPTCSSLPTPACLLPAQPSSPSNISLESRGLHTHIKLMTHCKSHYKLTPTHTNTTTQRSHTKIEDTIVPPSSLLLFPPLADKVKTAFLEDAKTPPFL